jgi:hypothetical protein
MQPALAVLTVRNKTAEAVRNFSWPDGTQLKQGVNETVKLSSPVLHFVPERS